MDPFLQDCGVTHLDLVVERAGAGAAPERVRVDRPFAFVGRGERNDVRLDDPSVSRRHAYLQAVAGRVFCVDLASRTGVHWPSGRRASGWADWDEPLRVGPAVVRAARPPRDPRKTALIVRPGRAAAAPSPEVVLEIAGPGAAPVRWRMNRPLVLVGRGRDRPCRIRRHDDRVSRCHCALVRGRDEVWAVDLLSRDGTRWNGQALPWARLAEGEAFAVGRFVLRLWRPQPTEAPEAPEAAPPRTAVAPLLANSRGLAAPTDAAGLAPLMLPVLHEFNRMQQQMLDQFHQTMLMMAEMFTTLHRDQSALVRRELDELRRVTAELTALHAEQVVRGQAAAAAAPARDAAAETPEQAAGATADAAKEEEAPEAEREAEAPAAAATAPSRPAGAKAADPEVHAWLSGRIAALQEERNSRWQKILRLVTGRTAP